MTFTQSSLLLLAHQTNLLIVYISLSSKCLHKRWRACICYVSRPGNRSVWAENPGCTWLAGGWEQWGKLVWEQSKTWDTFCSPRPATWPSRHWAQPTGQLSKQDLQRAFAFSYSITPEGWAGQALWKGKRMFYKKYGPTMCVWLLIFKYFKGIPW